MGQALATEAIAECIRGGSVWEAESNIEWLDLVSTPAAANWDAAFTVERINLQQNIAKAFRRKCEFDHMREVPFVRMPDEFAFARSHLAPILLSFLLRFFFVAARRASNVQCSAAFLYALFMNGSVACAARCLALSALCRQALLSDGICGGSSNAPNQAAGAALAMVMIRHPLPGCDKSRPIPPLPRSRLVSADVRSNRRPRLWLRRLVSFSSAELLRDRKVCTSDILAFASLQLMTSLAAGRTIANVNPPAAVPQITGADT